MGNVNDCSLFPDIFLNCNEKYKKDGDGSGMIDPQELKQAFLDLGFGGQNKFVYQILA